MDELSGGIEGSGEDPEATGRTRDQPADHAETHDADSTGGTGADEGPSETLTRDEYADQMRHGPAVEPDEAPGHQRQEHGRPEPTEATQTDAGAAAGSELAEPRTRDEVASEARAAGEQPGRDDVTTAARDDPAGDADDTAASSDIRRQQQLAEPRTRDEVASEARAGTEPATGTQEPGTAPADNRTGSAAGEATSAPFLDRGTDQQKAGGPMAGEASDSATGPGEKDPATVGQADALPQAGNHTDQGAQQPGNRTPELEHRSVPVDQAQARGQPAASAYELADGPGQGPAQDIKAAELPPAEHAAHKLAETPDNQADLRPPRDEQLDETGTDKPATTEQPVSAGEQLDQQAQEHADGHREPNWRLTVVPADRAVGDTTPTGIGRKPTGEELLHDRDDRADSRLDRLLDSAFEHADDVHDGTDQIDKAIASDLRPVGGPSGHPAHHQSYAGYERPQLAYYQRGPPDSPGISDAVGSIVVVGIAAAVALRRGWERRRREHEQ